MSYFFFFVFLPRLTFILTFLLTFLHKPFFFYISHLRFIFFPCLRSFGTVFFFFMLFFCFPALLYVLYPSCTSSFFPPNYSCFTFLVYLSPPRLSPLLTFIHHLLLFFPCFSCFLTSLSSLLSLLFLVPSHLLLPDTKKHRSGQARTTLLKLRDMLTKMRQTS